MGLSIGNIAAALLAPNSLNRARLRTRGNRQSPLRKTLGAAICRHAMETIRSNHDRANVYYSLGSVRSYVQKLLPKGGSWYEVDSPQST
jgi:hypothetical protein